EYIRRAAVTVHHPCGSCRMGADDQAVVDEQLRVRGVEALRVADASVFPRVVSGNTNAAVVMIAEKAADMIRGIPAPRGIDLPLTAPASAGDTNKTWGRFHDHGDDQTLANRRCRGSPHRRSERLRGQHLDAAQG